MVDLFLRLPFFILSVSNFRHAYYPLTDVYALRNIYGSSILFLMRVCYHLYRVYFICSAMCKFRKRSFLFKNLFVELYNVASCIFL